MAIYTSMAEDLNSRRPRTNPATIARAGLVSGTLGRELFSAGQPLSAAKSEKLARIIAPLRRSNATILL